MRDKRFSFPIDYGEGKGPCGAVDGLIPRGEPLIDQSLVRCVSLDIIDPPLADGATFVVGELLAFDAPTFGVTGRFRVGAWDPEVRILRLQRLE